MSKICVGYAKFFGLDVIGLLEKDEDKVLKNCYAITQHPQNGKPGMSHLPRSTFFNYSILGRKEELDVPLEDIYFLSDITRYANSVSSMFMSMYNEMSSVKTIEEARRRNEENLKKFKEAQDQSNGLVG